MLSRLASRASIVRPLPAAAVPQAPGNHFLALAQPFVDAIGGRFQAVQFNDVPLAGLISIMGRSSGGQIAC